jgi:hypothetical protein
MKTKLASEMPCIINRLDDGQVPKKKIMLVKFSHALFSLVDFFTLKVGLIGCPKTSVRNYRSVLPIASEELSSH